VEAAWQAWQGSLERLRALDLDAAECERRRELLQFQVQELMDAGLKPGEREALLKERGLLQSALKRAQAASLALAALRGGDEGASAVASLAIALKALKELASLDPSVAPLAGRLESMSIEADDLSHSLSQAASAIEDDPGRLEAVESRLALLDALQHKHKRDETGLLAFLEEAQAQLNDLVDVEAARQALRREILSGETSWGKAAKALSAKRRAGALGLAKKVMERLRRLGMEKADFSVALEPQAPGPRGGEAAEFMLAANLGEGAKPLSKVASGGELSRLMLAIKAALSDLDPADTLVFDEVDAGISGKVAEEVGRELARLAGQRQALCVTHLPQIACLPGTHLQVSKQVKAGRTSTQVLRLDEAGRVEAIASLLGGAQATESARAHARQLLASAGAQARPA
jgi:DNA repair protein RecN (Recombination protein N)